MSKLEVYARFIERGRVAVADLVRGDGDARALAVGFKLIGDVPAGKWAFPAIVGKDIAVLFCGSTAASAGSNGTERIPAAVFGSLIWGVGPVW